MYRRLLLSEDEKQNIKNLYSIQEQQEQDDIQRMSQELLRNAIEKVKQEFANEKSSGTNNSKGPLGGSSSLGKISDKGQALLNNPVFKQKLKEISDAIHIDEQSILKLMKHESGLDPTVKNSIGCVGLIQFCPSGGSTKVVNGQSYSLEDLRNNLEVQMDAIKDFWKKGYDSGKIKSPHDLYIYNFFPVAAGKSDDFVLQSGNLTAQKVAKANPVFNRTLGKPADAPLTVGDLKNYYQKTGMV